MQITLHKRPDTKNPARKTPHCVRLTAGSLLLPQALTRTRRNVVKLLSLGEKLCQFFTRVLGTHEGFANKKGINLMLAHQGYICGLVNGTFGDHDTVLGNLRQ